MSQEAPRQSKIEAPWTVQRLRDWTTQFLGKKGIEKPEVEAQILLAHALSWKRLDLFMRQDEEPPEDARQRFRDLVRQRAEGCPTAYLVGRKEFFSLEFEVSPAVLIPRDDTEWILTEFLRLAKEKTEPTVLDVGTDLGGLAVGRGDAAQDGGHYRGRHQPRGTGCRSSQRLAARRRRPHHVPGGRSVRSSASRTTVRVRPEQSAIYLSCRVRAAAERCPRLRATA